MELLVSLEAKDLWGMQDCMECIMTLLTCSVCAVWGIPNTQVLINLIDIFAAHFLLSLSLSLQTYCDQHLITL